MSMETLQLTYGGGQISFRLVRHNRNTLATEAQ
jgi:hypothetical protein